ncbi:unnamed protein product [Protopolystoma xenopodis]|uniref:Uncharacterized protein n=1 Tax=Protopolystoma xenopodis TaxID=117903 RepID=A0A3S4ZAG2_9PLAT|nr:unnamed protein product [Protopolystoma xenopodis]
MNVLDRLQRRLTRSNEPSRPTSRTSQTLINTAYGQQSSTTSHSCGQVRPHITPAQTDGLIGLNPNSLNPGFWPSGSSTFTGNPSSSSCSRPTTLGMTGSSGQNHGIQGGGDPHAVTTSSSWQGNASAYPNMRTKHSPYLQEGIGPSQPGPTLEAGSLALHKLLDPAYTSRAQPSVYFDPVASTRFYDPDCHLPPQLAQPQQKYHSAAPTTALPSQPAVSHLERLLEMEAKNKRSTEVVGSGLLGPSGRYPSPSDRPGEIASLDSDPVDSNSFSTTSTNSSQSEIEAEEKLDQTTTGWSKRPIRPEEQSGGQHRLQWQKPYQRIHGEIFPFSNSSNEHSSASRADIEEIPISLPLESINYPDPSQSGEAFIGGASKDWDHRLSGYGAQSHSSGEISKLQHNLLPDQMTSLITTSNQPIISRPSMLYASATSNPASSTSSGDGLTGVFIPSRRVLIGPHHTQTVIPNNLEVGLTNETRPKLLPLSSQVSIPQPQPTTQIRQPSVWPNSDRYTDRIDHSAGVAKGPASMNSSSPIQSGNDLFSVFFNRLFTRGSNPQSPQPLHVHNDHRCNQTYQQPQQNQTLFHSRSTPVAFPQCVSAQAQTLGFQPPNDRGKSSASRWESPARNNAPPGFLAAVSSDDDSEGAYDKEEDEEDEDEEEHHNANPCQDSREGHHALEQHTGELDAYQEADEDARNKHCYREDGNPIHGQRDLPRHENGANVNFDSQDNTAPGTRPTGSAGTGRFSRRSQRLRRSLNRAKAALPPDFADRIGLVPLNVCLGHSRTSINQFHDYETEVEREDEELGELEMGGEHDSRSRCQHQVRGRDLGEEEAKERDEREALHEGDNEVNGIEESTGIEEMMSHIDLLGAGVGQTAATGETSIEDSQTTTSSEQASGLEADYFAESKPHETTVGNYPGKSNAELVNAYSTDLYSGQRQQQHIHDQYYKSANHLNNYHYQQHQRQQQLQVPHQLLERNLSSPEANIRSFDELEGRNRNSVRIEKENIASQEGRDGSNERRNGGIFDATRRLRTHNGRGDEISERDKQRTNKLDQTRHDLAGADEEGSVEEELVSPDFLDTCSGLKPRENE